MFFSLQLAGYCTGLETVLSKKFLALMPLSDIFIQSDNMHLNFIYLCEEHHSAQTFDGCGV